jgi:hypothetical protein
MQWNKSIYKTQIFRWIFPIKKKDLLVSRSRRRWWWRPKRFLHLHYMLLYLPYIHSDSSLRDLQFPQSSFVSLLSFYSLFHFLFFVLAAFIIFFQFLCIALEVFFHLSSLPSCVVFDFIFSYFQISTEEQSIAKLT